MQIAYLTARLIPVLMLIFAAFLADNRAFNFQCFVFLLILLISYLFLLLYYVIKKSVNTIRDFFIFSAIIQIIVVLRVGDIYFNRDAATWVVIVDGVGIVCMAHIVFCMTYKVVNFCKILMGFLELKKISKMKQKNVPAGIFSIDYIVLKSLFLCVELFVISVLVAGMNSPIIEKEEWFFFNSGGDFKYFFHDAFFFAYTIVILAEGIKFFLFFGYSIVNKIKNESIFFNYYYLFLLIMHLWLGWVAIVGLLETGFKVTKVHEFNMIPIIWLWVFCLPIFILNFLIFLLSKIHLVRKIRFLWSR